MKFYNEVWRLTLSSSQCHGDPPWRRERADRRGYGGTSAGTGSAPGSDLEDQRCRIGRLLARPAQQRQLQRGGVLKVPGLAVTVKSFKNVVFVVYNNIVIVLKLAGIIEYVTCFAKTKQACLESVCFHCMIFNAVWMSRNSWYAGTFFLHKFCFIFLSNYKVKQYHMSKSVVFSK